MNQLTIRGFDDDLAALIRQMAAEDGTSLNKAALKLMRRGAGLSPVQERRDVVRSSLDHLTGSWGQVQAEEFDQLVEVFEAVDESDWR